MGEGEDGDGGENDGDDQCDADDEADEQMKRRWQQDSIDCMPLQVLSFVSTGRRISRDKCEFRLG